MLHLQIVTNCYKFYKLQIVPILSILSAALINELIVKFIEVVYEFIA